MVNHYRLTTEARRDLIDIQLYGLEHFGQVQADEYATILERKLQLFADNPNIGRDYSHVLIGIRRYENIAHSIYYEPEDAGVLIVRILHSKMDPARHF